MAVLRDVDVEVALDMPPHTLRPLPRLSDRCNGADAAGRARAYETPLSRESSRPWLEGSLPP